MFENSVHCLGSFPASLKVASRVMWLLSAGGLAEMMLLGFTFPSCFISGFSVLAWLSDRLFPSSAPYKLCGDISSQLPIDQKKKGRRGGREGGRKRSFLVVPTEIHKLILTGLARVMWPVTARMWQPLFGQFWVISFITPGMMWTSRRGVWAGEVLPNLTLFIYNRRSNK